MLTKIKNMPSKGHLMSFVEGNDGMVELQVRYGIRKTLHLYRSTHMFHMRCMFVEQRSWLNAKSRWGDALFMTCNGKQMLAYCNGWETNNPLNMSRMY